MGLEELEDYGVKLYRLVAAEGRPAKLFVGGLHGNEGLYTTPILERLAQEEISVSYTHLPSPRDRTRSRMPSSA